MFAGITSGAAAQAVVQLAKREEYQWKLIACMFADTGERYLSVEGLYE